MPVTTIDCHSRAVEYLDPPGAHKLACPSAATHLRRRIIEQEELREREPYLNDKAVAALFSPDAGIVTPYEFTIAVAENAVDNGAHLKLETEVVDITPESADIGGGFVVHTRAVGAPPSRARPFTMHQAIIGGITLLGGVAACAFANMPLWATVVVASVSALFSSYVARPQAPMPKTEHVRARFVVNAAGLFADKVAAMVGADDFKVCALRCIASRFVSHTNRLVHAAPSPPPSFLPPPLPSLGATLRRAKSPTR